MTSSAVSIAVVDGKTIIKAQELRASKNGEPLRIKAIEGGKYILAEGEKGFAPENVTVKRVGKDLHISLEGTNLDQPQLIIEGFYDTPGQVVGMAEDGSYYPYVASDAEHDHEVAFLMDDVSSPQVLGVEAVNGFGHDLVALAGSGILWPSVLGLGALALAGLGVAAVREDNGSSKPAPAPEVIPAPHKQPEIGAVTDNVGDKQGILLPGDVTDDTTPTFTGTGTPGSELKVTDNGEEIGKIVVDEKGNWEFTPEPPLGEGQHVIVIVPEKGGEPSDGFELVVDTKAPAQVQIDSITDDAGEQVGVIAHDGETDDTTPTLNGRAEAGSLVSIYNHGQLLGTAVADAKGNWQFTPTALADGEYVFTARATDAAGNIGLMSPPYAITIDTVAPQKPDLGGEGHGIGDVVDNEGSIQGSIINGGVTDDTTPTLIGKGEPGDTVSLIDNGNLIGKVVVDEKGEWTFTPGTELTEGKHDLTVVITDPAGNSSLPSDPWVINVDTTAPVNPGVESAIDDIGLIVGPIKNGETTDDNKPTLGGSSEPGATVIIKDNGQVIGEVVVDDKGQWTFTPEAALVDGEHGFTVVITDPAGNSSEESDPFVVVVDTVVPTKPSIESVFDDVGDVQGNLKPGATTDDSKPTLSGQAEANSTVVIYDKGVEIGSAPVDDKGQWTFTPTTPLSNGSHNLSVAAVDKAGNTSEKSDGFELVVFADGAPAAPAITAVKDDVGDIKGNIQKEGVTDDARPTLEGTAEAGTTVSIYSNGKLLGTVDADAKGNWSFTPDADLKDGLHTITATATNSAGNTSPSTGGYPITIDTVAPGKATAELSDDVGAIQGPIVSGDTTDDNTPTFSGKAEANSTVIIYDQGVEIGRVPVDGEGVWSFTPGTPLAEGSHSLSTAVVDKAGNLGEQSVPIDFTVNTDDLDIVIIRVTDDVGSKQGNLGNGDVTDDTKPTLHGKATANSTVNIYDGKVLLGSAQSNGKGEWSFTPTQALAEGEHSLTATVVTTVGGESAPTSVFDLTVDTAAPGKVVIGEVFDDVGEIQGPIANGGSTDDTTPTLSGNGEPGSTVHIYDNDSLLGSVEVDGKGNWSFTPSPLNNGEHSFTVTNEDKAGNVSAPSDAYVVTVDTIAPVKPTIESVYDDQGDVQGNLKPGEITDDTQPTLSGKAEANSSVVIYDKGVEIGRAPVDGKGNWTFIPTTALAGGGHTLTVKAVDVAGNTSVASDSFDFTVNASLLIKPSIESVFDDVGEVKGNLKSGDSTDDVNPSISGKAEANNTVVIYDKGVEIGSVPVDGKGNWTFTPTTALAEGDHTLTVKAIDATGNISGASDSFDLTIDTITPVKPTIESIYDDVGEVQGNLKPGATTDDSKPTLSGQAEANSTVVIYDKGVEIGSAPVDDKGQWTFTPTTPLSNGSHNLSVAAVDKAGNTSEKSDGFELVVFADGAPAAPAITAVKDDVGDIKGNIQKEGVTDDARPTLEGTAEAGTTVSIYSNGKLLGTVDADAKGNWSFTPDVDLKDGLHNLTATATNAAGNTSPQTGLFPITVDTTAPGKATAELSDDVGAIQGPIVSGDITDDNTPTFSGKAEANSTVVIYDQGVEIGRVPVDGKGVWSFTPGTPLAEGSHSLSTAVVDKAGNLGEQSVPIDFTVNTDDLDIVITRVVDDVGSKQGNLANGDVTDDTKPTLHGKATADSVVVIYDNAIEIGRVTSDASGSWHFTPAEALADGEHSLTATVFTAAAGESAPTSVFDLTVDTAAPGKAVIGEVFDDVGEIQGPITNGGSTDDTTPTLSGNGEPGSTVHIYDNDSLLGSVEVDGKGNWSFTPSPLNNGEHSFTVTNEDKAGNVSAPSDAYVVTVDTIAPVKPTIESVYDDVGDVQGNLKPGEITDDSKPTLSGKAEANSTVVIYDKGVEIGSALVDDKGQWTFTPTTPLSHGEHKLVVEAVDAAGNTSVKSDAFEFVTFADGAPAAPAITAVKDDVGSIKGDLQKNAVTDDARPTLEGTAEAGTTVSIYSNGKLLGTVDADTKGNWSFTPDVDLKDGLHNLTATTTNAAGNISPQTGLFPITVDTTAPGKATAELSDDVGAIQGPIVSGDTTDDNTPTFSGKAEANSTVVIYDQGVEIGRVPVDDKGVWSFTPGTPLAEGGHGLSTAVVDKAGNLGEQSAVIDFTVDTRAVDVSITRVADDVGSKQGNLGNGDVTDDTKPTLHGKATANSTVNIYDGKVLLGSAQSNGKGEWSFTPTQALAEGEHSLTATVVTAAGGESDPTSVFDLTVDTSAPGKAVIGEVFDDVGEIQGPITNGGSTDDTTPTLSGNGEPGSTVHIYDNDSLLGSVEVDGKGNWSFTPSPLNNGEHSFTVTNEDKAGNVSTPSDAYVVTVDTIAPVKPTIESVYDDVGDVQGNLKPGEITDDSKPTLSGKAEANSTVVIYDKGVEIGSALVDDKGQWTFTPTTPLSHGEHKLVVEAVDAAGNTSVKSDAFEFVTFADGAPAAPAITAVKDDVGSIKGDLQKNAVTDDARPTLEGTAEAGTTVSIYSNGKLLGTVDADAKGNWSFTPDVDLKDGLHNLTATTTNAAGNISPQTGLFPITVDTTAPGKATAELSDDVGAIQGPIVSGDTTDDNTPTFSGKAEANSTVVIYDQGVEIGRVPVDDKGVWSFTPGTPLAEGGHGLSTAVVDKAGNLGEQSAVIDFTVDTRAVDVTITRVADDVGSKQGNLANGDVTDDTKPTLHGKATANSTVNIYDGKVLLGSAQSNGKGEWSFTPTQALAEGEHSLTATVVTAAGGESDPTSVFDLTVDTSAPGKAVIGEVFDDVGEIQGPIANGGSTDDTTPTLSGNGEPGSTVHIYDNDSLLGSVEVDGKGNWSFTPSPLNNGEHSFTVTNEDKAGNVSAPSDAYVVTVDTIAPVKPTIESVYDDVGDVQGNLKPGEITDDSKPTLSGKAEANSTVVIYDKGVEIGSAPVDVSGNWVFTPTTALVNGSHTLTVAAFDTAGNSSDLSAGFGFTVDTAPPSKPTIDTVYDDVGSITGIVRQGGVTDDTKPTISGKAQANSTVVIYDKGVQIGSVVANAAGTWTFTPATALANGVHTLTAKAVNAAGNASAASDSFGFTVDTVAPLTPTIDAVYDDVGAITGVVKPGTVTDDTKPLISGKAEAGSTVIIYDKGVQIGSVTASASGGWTFTPSTALADGVHTLTAKAIDAAGNTSGLSAGFGFTVDTAPPGKPTIDTVYDDVGSITGIVRQGGVTDDTKPTISGKAEANSTVVIYDKGVQIGSVVANAAGTWTFTPETVLNYGVHTLTAKAVNAAGNASAASDSFGFTVDTVEPNTPAIDSVYDDVGSVTGNLRPGAITDDTKPLISGKAEAGSTVIIYDKGVQIGSVTASASGFWTFTPSTALADGVHTLTAKAIDAAGNSSGQSAGFGFTVDTAAPSKPTIDTVYDDVGSITGIVRHGGVTDDTKPTISGKAEANSTVVIYDKGVQIGSVVANAAGTWTFTPSTALVNGVHTLTAKAMNAAGNASAASDSFGFTVDTVAPLTPTIDAVYDDVGAITGVIKPGTVTDDTKPLISGKAEAGSTVIIYDKGAEIGSVTASASGGWTFTPSTALADGVHTLTAKAIDAAGNTSGLSAGFGFTVDTAPPGKPTIDTVYDDQGSITGVVRQGGVTDDTKPTVYGKAEANSTVVIYDKGVEIGSVTANASGSWSFTPSTALVNGVHTLTAKAFNASGNASAASDSFGFTVDTVAPLTPTIDAVYDDVGAITGVIKPGTVTDDTKPLISGKAEAGSTVIIYDKGAEIGSVTASASGGWTFTPSTALADGVHTLTAKATDVAGNTSGLSAGFGFTVDTATISITRVVDDFGVSQGNLAKGDVTDDSTPTLHGTANANSKVNIYDKGVLLGSTQSSSTGEWSFTTTKLPEGQHKLTATVVTAVGGESTPTSIFDFSIKNSRGNELIDFNRIPAGKFTSGSHVPGSSLKVESEDGLELITFKGEGDGSQKLWVGGPSTAVLTHYLTKFTLDEAAVKVTFEFYAESSKQPMYVAFFDLAGIEIGRQSWGTTPINNRSGFVSFTAPAGKAIGSFHYATPSGDGNGTLIDNINITRDLNGGGKLFAADEIQEEGAASNAQDSFFLSGVVNMEEDSSVLKISLADVLESGHNDMFVNDENVQMMIEGNEHNSVELSALLLDGTDIGSWESVGDVTVAGVVYNTYQHSTLDAELLVQQGVTVNLV